MVNIYFGSKDCVNGIESRADAKISLNRISKVLRSYCAAYFGNRVRRSQQVCFDRVDRERSHLSSVIISFVILMKLFGIFQMGSSLNM